MQEVIKHFFQSKDLRYSDDTPLRVTAGDFLKPTKNAFSRSKGKQQRQKKNRMHFREVRENSNDKKAVHRQHVNSLINMFLKGYPD